MQATSAIAAMQHAALVQGSRQPRRAAATAARRQVRVQATARVANKDLLEVAQRAAEAGAKVGKGNGRCPATVLPPVRALAPQPTQARPSCHSRRSPIRVPRVPQHRL